MTQTIEILNPNKKIKKPFDIFAPLWWNRSFWAWTNLLLAEIEIIIALTNYDRFLSYMFFFMAGLFFCSWFMESVIMNQRKLIDDMLGYLHRINEILEKRLN